MQCIEHVHGYVCSEFQKTAFREGLGPYNPTRHADAIRDTFFKMVKPAGVRANCVKLLAMVKWIVAHKGVFTALHS
jgi:mannose/fructose/N-acetylgalactosamine-specific phosphotransferase system component IIB